MKDKYVIALKRNEYDTVNYLVRKENKNWSTDTVRWNATVYNKIARAQGVVRLLGLENEAYIERISFIDRLVKLVKERMCK